MKPQSMTILAVAMALALWTREAWSDTASQHRLVLIIRTGSLDTAKLIAQEQATPHLRQLLLDGTSLPRIAVGAASGGVRVRPEAILDRILPPAVVAHLREHGIVRVIVGPRTQESTSNDHARPTTEQRALVALHEHFARPRSAADAERNTVRILRKLLGLAEGGEAQGHAPATAPRQPQTAVETVSRTFDRGGRLVVLLEHVDGDTDAVQVRDKELGELIDAVAATRRTTIAVLLVPDDPVATGLFLCRGPNLRSGWVVPGKVAPRDLTPTIFKFLRCKPPASQRTRDAIDEIFAD